MPLSGVDGGVSVIALSRGMFATVSRADFARVAAYRWHAIKGTATWYAGAKIDGKHVGMHRFLLQPGPGLVVDHIDCNGLNNTRQNIRVCTQQQNASRRLDFRKDKGLRGAYRHHRGNKWISYITAHGKQHYLGCFSTEKEASDAYFAAAERLFGEFAPDRGIA